ncbi:MAG: hypothetical protein BWY88_00895 [Synergistetes bacterium ADurb.Bin520]|nr:MAG: hypothetical protein BWY88_00895 [Synergistetes bacterium ADurb.Bin520]
MPKHLQNAHLAAVLHQEPRLNPPLLVPLRHPQRRDQVPHPTPPPIELHRHPVPMHHPLPRDPDLQRHRIWTPLIRPPGRSCRRRQMRGVGIREAVTAQGALQEGVVELGVGVGVVGVVQLGQGRIPAAAGVAEVGPPVLGEGEVGAGGARLVAARLDGKGYAAALAYKGAGAPRGHRADEGLRHLPGASDLLPLVLGGGARGWKGPMEFLEHGAGGLGDDGGILPDGPHDVGHVRLPVLSLGPSLVPALVALGKGAGYREPHGDVDQGALAYLSGGALALPDLFEMDGHTQVTQQRGYRTTVEFS